MRSSETVLGALVTSVGSQFTTGMLQNGGNFGKAAKTLTDKKFLKGLATQLAVAGLSAGIMAHFDIKVPSGADASKLSFTDLAAQHAKVQAVQQGVSGTARVIRGEKLGTVLRDGIIQGVASSVAAAAANKTGALKSDGKINNAGHKILHAGIGAGLGAATSKNRAAGAAAGAAGAFVGESVAEMVGDDAATTRAKATEDVRKSGKPMTDENIGKAYRARVETAMNWGKLAAGFVAFAAGMDVTTALFTAANALHNNYATTAEREASRGEQASSSGDGRPDDPEEQKLIDEINSCERMLDDMKKDAEESGSVIKKIMCFLTEVIVDVDGDFMTEAPRARLRLYKLQHDTPKVIRDGLKLLQDYQAGKPLDSNDVHSYLKMLDQWGPHVTGTMAGLAGVRGNLKGRQAFRPNAQAHKPGCASGHEFKPQSLTVEALGLEGRGFSGRSGFEMENPSFQKARNTMQTINNRLYSGHALDQMQNRGIPISVVDNTITNGTIFPTRPGTTGYYEAGNNVRVIMNSQSGKIVTVIRGKP